MKAVYLKVFLLYLFYFSSLRVTHAQTALPLTSLDYFSAPGPSWSIAGNVSSGFADKAALITYPGTGVLANISDELHPGKDILSKEQYGGLDLEMDYLMAPGSRSGIYLQGRYKISLRDSWGMVQPTAADNGGIDGHAPRQNVSRAPGLWQHIKISFQAPQFNSEGKKTASAVILKVELNGVSIQENIELAGPARDALLQDEVPLGPLRIEGDHGSVAFRNIKITSYNGILPQLQQLKYEVYKGKFEDEAAIKKTPPDITGKAQLISMNVTSFPPLFLTRFSGLLKVKTPGSYHFILSMAGGRGLVRLNNQDIILLGQGRGSGSGDIQLPAGEYPLVIIYSKLVSWDKPAIALEISGPGIRLFKISDANAGADHENPILVEAPVNTMLRSFADIDTFKITHAANVGSPLGIHYTYDLDKGMIVRIWRGDFLDVSTMWHGRGDGTPRPMGMVQLLGAPVPVLEKLKNGNEPWLSDTSGSGFRTKGYVMDASDRPAFRYLFYGSLVTDSTTVLDEGHGIHRTILINKPVDQVYLKLATASRIEKLSGGLYMLEDKSYYIRMDEGLPDQPVIRELNGKKELIIPFRQSVSYSILF